MEINEIKQISNYIIRNFDRNQIKNILDDIYQEAYIGYLYGNKTFNKDQSSYKTWIFNNIKWKILDFIKSEFKHSVNIYEMNKEKVFEGEESSDPYITYDHSYYKYNPDILQTLETESFINKIEQLTNPDICNMLIGYYDKNLSKEEVAENIKLSIAGMKCKVYKLKGKLNKMLKVEDNVIK